MKTKDLIDKMIDGNKGPMFSFHSASSISAIDKSKVVDSEKWPAEWVKINFKSYPRLLQIKLQTPHPRAFNIYKVIRKRESKRDFNKLNISVDEISTLLYYSAGIINDPKDWNQSRRAYPSAGARYPLEVYAVILRADSFKPGLYHYNVKSHALELLVETNLSNEVAGITGQEWAADTSIVFIITALTGRSTVKYGDRAYRYCLIETGHLAQNIYMVAAVLKLKCCAVGGFVDKAVNELLDIDGENELPLYILGIGK